MEGEQLRLLGIVVLPLVAGLLAAGLGLWTQVHPHAHPWVQRLQRWLQPHVAGLASQLCLGAAGLAGLLAVFTSQDLVAGSEPRVVFNPWMWAELGVGRPLPFGFQFDALAGFCAYVSLFCALIYHAYAQIRGRGPGAHAAVAIATSGALMVALSRSLWVAAVGWHLVGGAAIACVVIAAPTRAAKLTAGWWAHRRQRVTDLLLWLAIVALASVAIGFDPLSVTALMQERSVLVSRSLAGVSLAVVAAFCLLAATYRRLLGVVSGPVGEADVGGELVRFLGGLGALALVCRLHMVVALAPGVMAGTAIVGLCVSLGGALIAAVVTRDRARYLGLTHLGLVLIALGLGDWVLACVIHTVTGLLSLGERLVSHSYKAGRASRVVVGLGFCVLAGRLWASGWGRMSLWTPGINWALALGLPVVVVLTSHAYANISRPGKKSGPHSLAVIGGAVWGGAFAVLAAYVAAPGEIAWLERTLARVGGEAATFRGVYALGWLPSYYNAESGGPTIQIGMLRVAGAVVAFGLWVVGARGQLPAGVRRFAARCGSLHQRGAITLRRLLGLPVEVIGLAATGIARWQRQFMTRVRPPGKTLPTQLWVAGILLVTGAILATVYMHPRAVTFGPTPVHPVDLGGLHPEIVSARRGGGGSTTPTQVPSAPSAHDQQVSEAAKRAAKQPIVRDNVGEGTP